MALKRWQVELLGVLLLALALTFLMGRRAIAIQLTPILWLAGRSVIARSIGERLLTSVTRFVVASFAAVGILVAFQATVPRGFFDSMPQLIELGPIAFLAFSSVFVYWLQDAYALIPSGMGRTIARVNFSLILASFAAIGIVIAFLAGYFLSADPVESPNFGWMGWAVPAGAFLASFYATWKLLQESHRSIQGVCPMLLDRVQLDSR